MASSWGPGPPPRRSYDCSGWSGSRLRLPGTEGPESDPFPQSPTTPPEGPRPRGRSSAPEWLGYGEPGSAPPLPSRSTAYARRWPPSRPAPSPKSPVAASCRAPAKIFQRHQRTTTAQVEASSFGCKGGSPPRSRPSAKMRCRWRHPRAANVPSAATRLPSIIGPSKARDSTITVVASSMHPHNDHHGGNQFAGAPGPEHAAGRGRTRGRSADLPAAHGPDGRRRPEPRTRARTD